MGYQLISPPAAEPLSLVEAKLHLKVDVSDDDALITALISAVRQYAETELNRSLVTQSWKYTMDRFPGALGFSRAAPWGTEYSHPDNVLLLEKGPHTSITSINYVDMSGSAQVMPPADYVADLTGPLARITPVFGKIWPVTLPQIASASVTFVAGYGAAAAVPEGIKSWMKLRLSALYENREEVIVGTIVTPVPYFDSLLNPFRAVVY